LELMKLIHICANATYPKDDVHRLNMGVKTKKHSRLLKSSVRSSVRTRTLVCRLLGAERSM
jgi:hypothetical protein